MHPAAEKLCEIYRKIVAFWNHRLSIFAFKVFMWPKEECVISATVRETSGAGKFEAALSLRNG